MLSGSARRQKALARAQQVGPLAAGLPGAGQRGRLRHARFDDAEGATCKRCWRFRQRWGLSAQLLGRGTTELKARAHRHYCEVFRQAHNARTRGRGTKMADDGGSKPVPTYHANVVTSLLSTDELTLELRWYAPEH